ncbi:glycosyl transferase, group 2 family protein, partial [gut metagenome]
MAENKEKNFVSAVVYLRDQQEMVQDFFEKLNRQLSAHFEHYELIAVNDGCIDETVVRLKKWAKNTLAAPLTIINMSLRQGLEPAMNAGLDAAIGDFLYEFDSMEIYYQEDVIWQAYQKALNGFDVVNVCP